MNDFRDQRRYDAHQEAMRNSRRAKQRATARAIQRKRRMMLIVVLLLPVTIAAFAFTWSRSDETPKQAPPVTEALPDQSAAE